MNTSFIETLVNCSLADTVKKDTTDYFNHAQLVGSVKVGDIVFVNAGGTFGALLITAVDVKAKTITTKVATLGA